MGIYDLMQGIQQQGEEGRKRGLAQLVGKAYGAPPDQRQQILGTVAQRGAPDMALEADKAFGAQEDNVHLQMAKRAAEVVALYKSNPQMAQQVYQNGLLPIAARAGVNNAPQQLDDSLIEGLTSLASAAGGGDEMKSLTKGANGNYWAIKNGQYVDTGVPFNPETTVRDQPGVPFDILNKRTGGSIYDQQPQSPQLTPNSAYQTPGGIVKIGDVAPEDMAAVQADILANGASDSYALPPRDVSPGAQGRPPSRPQTAPISDYQRESLGIQRDRLTAAQQARDSAAAAKKAADDAKATQKQQVADRRQADSAESANMLVDSIDALLQSPGYGALGTVGGDVQIATPLLRNDAKDANAQLQNVSGQVALATMAKLKALSSQGATGFGSLSAPELKLLQNAIATVQSGEISNAQLTKSLKIIRDSMEKVANWRPQGNSQQPAQYGVPATDPLGIL